MRLVLGDDQRLFVDALAVALAGHGLTVAAVATSPEEILAAVARYRPDVCLLGARFPNSGGLEVVRAIGGRHPAVRVVMLCDSSDPAAVSAAIKGGAAGLIRTDQRVEDIAHALTRVWAGERIIDGDLLRAMSRSFHRPACGDNGWPLGFLTSRELEVLMRMMEGECTKHLARSLEIAQSTARTHARNVLAKLGAHSRLEATAIAAKAGLPGRLGR
jgi:two-component system, NarL family, nitrate/nitrite response regulator NarL